MANVGQIVSTVLGAAQNLVTLEAEVETALATLKASPKHPSDYLKFAAAQCLAAAPVADQLAPLFEPAATITP